MARAADLARSRLSAPYKRLRRMYEPIRRRVQGTLTREELRDALAEAGVVPGATVMTHVSMDELIRTTSAINALELIALLKELLTEEGTLLVPTFPFTGREADYLATNPSFDVRRTPSQSGLMTELFRRMPDTVRSLHPTHPVSGWGAHAAEILSTHHLGETFAETSPFCRLREYDGAVVGIGVGIMRGFTIIHAAEYLHPEARAYAFSSQAETVTLKDGETMIDYTFHPLRVGPRRHGRSADPRTTEVLTYRRHAGLLISSARADAFIERLCELISRGSFYASGPLPPQ
ncbi:MAG: AAC(3) family N-acetyltransferase [Solirubrobacteraceae bacterium]|jgi:aminoglycoside N3'-acetyltransferase